MILGLGCLIIYGLMNLFQKEKPTYQKSPFSEMRKEYFDRVGLSKQIPRGKYNWKPYVKKKYR